MKEKLLLFGKDTLIFISFFLIYAFLYKIAINFFNMNTIIIANVIEIIIYLLLCIYLLFIYRKTIIRDFKDFLKNWKKIFNNNVSVYIISIIIMYVCNIILFTIIGSISTNEALSRESLANNIIPSIISMCIFAPYYEEILFRMSFRNLFKNKYVYIISMGLLFGSMHLISSTTYLEMLYLIPYSVMGMGFALMYYKTNNIFTSVMFHSINNLSVILILFLGGSL